MKITALQPDQLETVWEQFRPQVERGLKHGCGDSHRPEHIKESLESGDMIWLLAHDEEKLYGGLIIQVSQMPAKKSVFIVMAAGENMDLCTPYLEIALEKIRDSIDADAVECYARPGMEKKLLARGWRRKAVIMEAPNGRRRR